MHEAKVIGWGVGLSFVGRWLGWVLQGRHGPAPRFEEYRTYGQWQPRPFTADLVPRAAAADRIREVAKGDAGPIDLVDLGFRDPLP